MLQNGNHRRISQRVSHRLAVMAIIAVFSAGLSGCGGVADSLWPSADPASGPYAGEIPPGSSLQGRTAEPVEPGLILRGAPGSVEPDGPRPGQPGDDAVSVQGRLDTDERAALARRVAEIEEQVRLDRAGTPERRPIPNLSVVPDYPDDALTRSEAEAMLDALRADRERALRRVEER